jgi:NAD-dependent SIR2 family protein deacetylase
MAKIKNIEAFCGFCNTTTKMELGSEAITSVDNKRWAKCKKCKQMRHIVYEEPLPKKRKKQAEEEINIDNSVKYSPNSFFEIGTVIFHEGWNDFGTVLSKEILSNGKNAINVKFQKSGQKKLIETQIQTLQNPIEAR